MPQNENLRCWFCGGRITISGDEDIENVYPDYEGEGIVYYGTCHECGCEYECIQPTDGNRSSVKENDIKERIDFYKNNKE